MKLDEDIIETVYSAVPKDWVSTRDIADKVRLGVHQVAFVLSVLKRMDRVEYRCRVNLDVRCYGRTRMGLWRVKT